MMHEINPKVAFDQLNEMILELVTVCGGWDEDKGRFKPGVREQHHLIMEELRDTLGLPMDE